MCRRKIKVLFRKKHGVFFLNRAEDSADLSSKFFCYTAEFCGVTLCFLKNHAALPPKNGVFREKTPRASPEKKPISRKIAPSLVRPSADFPPKSRRAPPAKKLIFRLRRAFFSPAGGCFFIQKALCLSRRYTLCENRGRDNFLQSGIYRKILQARF